MEDIVKQFLSAYYDMMSNNRANAVSMYTENSTMTYNGDVCQGTQAIKEKIESFSFQSINVMIIKQL